jgi:hypothetical protein
MTNPQFAIAVLLIIAAIAGFSLVVESSKCRQTHDADYSCFPPDNPSISRYGRVTIKPDPQ